MQNVSVSSEIRHDSDGLISLRRYFAEHFQALNSQDQAAL